MNYGREMYYDRKSEIIEEGIALTFFGEYIDLSKIVSISTPVFIDRMGSGGYYVGFEIKCQLLKDPIRYERKFEYDESKWYLKKHHVVYGDSGKPLALERLMKEASQLIALWIHYKKTKE